MRNENGQSVVAGVGLALQGVFAFQRRQKYVLYELLKHNLLLRPPKSDGFLIVRTSYKCNIYTHLLIKYGFLFLFPLNMRFFFWEIPIGFFFKITLIFKQFR